jgi:hypothetical protein
MLYELARRLKEEGRSAAEIRVELEKVGASREEIGVLLGSLGFSAQPLTAAPELLAKTSRVTSSRWLLGLLVLLLLAALGPLVYLGVVLIDSLRVGR